MPNADQILDILLALESARQPLTDRAGLGDVLAQVVQAIAALTGAAYVEIVLCAEVFVPPLPLTIGSGDPAGNTMARAAYDLDWAGVQLARVTVSPAPIAGTEPRLFPLVLRMATETIAEVRVAEELVQRATTQTQLRIADALHADVKQVLAGIRLLAERVTFDLHHDPAAATTRLHTIRSAAQQAIDDLLFMLGNLRDRPVIPDLEHVIDHLLVQVSHARPEIDVQVQATVPPLSAHIAACLVGVVRNGLANVLQHAQAHTVMLVVKPEHNGVLLHIRDDGVGYDLEAGIAAPGMGLESILERVQALGGRATLQSAPGAGAMVEVWLPRC